MTNPEFKEISVECYSGFKANERPIAFTCEGERREILEITDRWYEGGLDSAGSSNSFQGEVRGRRICLLATRQSRINGRYACDRRLRPLEDPAGFGGKAIT